MTGKQFLITGLLFCLLIVGPGMGRLEAGQTWMTWNTRSGLPSNNLTCLAIDKGKMAVGSDKGIGLFCEGYASWFNLANYNEKLTDVVVRSIDFDEYGTLWAATPNGLFSISLEKFPEEAPEVRVYDHQQGLSTIDVEVVQICESKIYVGCFGGWLFSSDVTAGSAISSFLPVNSMTLGSEDSNKFLSVGITALAMDYPEGGIFSTKGKGLLRAASGENLVGQDELFSDWVNDFWAFEDGKAYKIIAVTQNQMNLISNNQPVGRCTLPAEESWISCVTTAPDEETDEYKLEKPKGYMHLETFMGKRILYAGTVGQGLWVFNDGRWSNLTTRDSPLPSDKINKVYYLPGSKKLAILSDGGLTMLGITQDTQFDMFKHKGADPYWAKTFWPFMQFWGPYIYGYPTQKAYPIEPFIAYGKIMRGKDLWIAHDKGLSRFIFPAAPFMGTMQYRHQLAGRFAAKANDPVKNLQIEDNSTSGDQPPVGPGEELWHHYCKQMPNDYPGAPLGLIYASLDMQTIAGPGNATSTPVTVEGDRRFDARRQELFSIASLQKECPIHPVPSENVTDYVLDLSERVWAIFDNNQLICLDNRIGETVPDSANNDWYEFAPAQLPWEKSETLLCVQKVGSSIYVSADNSGVYTLDAAHGVILQDLRASDWKRIELPPDSDQPDQFKKIIAIEYWKTDKGELVAMLHKDSLSVFDGQTLRPMAVPKRSYTCMVMDRNHNLWLGSMQGLLYLTPGEEVKTISGRSNNFNSERVITMAAAPDDAKYPFVIAVAVDEQAREESGTMKFFRSADTPPALFRGRDNPHRLRVVNSGAKDSQVMLFDGEKWEPMFRPGVTAMMFDQSFLWVSTSCRVMRLYLPVVVQSY